MRDAGGVGRCDGSARLADERGEGGRSTTVRDATARATHPLRFGVVVVNWNGIDDTLAALDSLLTADPRPAHVVVVENGSYGDDVAQLTAWAAGAGVVTASASTTVAPEVHPAPWFLIVDAGENLGFSLGNNVGLEYLARATDATHFLLLNNDARVAPDYFARIGAALAEVPDAGVMGCAIYYWPDTDRVWYAGGYEVPSRALICHAYDVPGDSRPRATEFVTGCAMLIARALYERVGGLAACYTPIYWEDGEYSHRAREAGWSVVWAPAARVYHKVGASGGGERLTPRVAYLQNRNRGYFVRRNYRGVQRAVALGYLFATKPGRSVVELLRGRPVMAWAFFRGFVRGITDRVT